MRFHFSKKRYQRVTDSVLTYLAGFVMAFYYTRRHCSCAASLAAHPVIMVVGPMPSIDIVARFVLCLDFRFIVRIFVTWALSRCNPGSIISFSVPGRRLTAMIITLRCSGSKGCTVVDLAATVRFLLGWQRLHAAFAVHRCRIGVGPCRCER